MITERDIFMKVWNHFVIEKNPPGWERFHDDDEDDDCGDAEGGCCYRTSEGRPCAIGLFISNEAYDVSFDAGEDPETMDLGKLISNGLLPGEISAYRILLWELQQAHDVSAENNMLAADLEGFRRDFEAELIHIGRKHKIRLIEAV